MSTIACHFFHSLIAFPGFCFACRCRSIFLPSPRLLACCFLLIPLALSFLSLLRLCLMLFLLLLFSCASSLFCLSSLSFPSLSDIPKSNAILTAIPPTRWALPQGQARPHWPWSTHSPRRRPCWLALGGGGGRTLLAPWGSLEKKGIWPW